MNAFDIPILPTLDFDNGGLATALEWVPGGDPTDSSDDTVIPKPGFRTVVVRIPKALADDNKLFARLEVITTTP